MNGNQVTRLLFIDTNRSKNVARVKKKSLSGKNGAMKWAGKAVKSELQ